MDKCFILRYGYGRTKEVAGVTLDQEVAQQWVDNKNKDWQLSGEVSAPASYEVWPLAEDLLQALDASKTKRAMEEADKLEKVLANASSDAREILAGRHITL